MRVAHISGKRRISRESDNPQFMLRNHRGDFFFMPSRGNISKYNGMHICLGEEMYKVIEDITAGIEAKEIQLREGKIVKIGDGSKESIKFHDEGIIFTNNSERKITIRLDPRKIYDFSTQGRIFREYFRDGKLIVEYTKYSDDSLSEIEYKIYIGISGIRKVDRNGYWEETYYPYDQNRGENFKDYVYNALRIEARTLHISAGFSEEEVILKLYMMKHRKDIGRTVVIEKKSMDDDLFFSSMYAQNSIRHFFVKDEGIYAGLPWFFQFWTRDEAISLRGLYLSGEGKAKNILAQELNILPDGRVPNRHPHSILGSADGVGWLFRRVLDLDFTKKEMSFIQKKLKESIRKIEEHYVRGGLVHNNAKETWMDTVWDDDTREGARIEIQALMLNMYRLSGDPKEEDLKKRVLEEFFVDGMLKDGKNDSTIRPNVFLAHYIYPDLLKNKEWEKVFDTALKELWLPWGGLSSISNKSPLFCPNYTGVNNKSYHRGDSWLFVNHLAAISMFRVNRKKYKEYIDKIISAGKKDILELGCIGDISEISSASEQRAEGSLAQAWSAATFVELIKEVYGI